MREIDAVGAVVLDGDRILLVQRGHEPGLHLWSVPGGRVEDGESDAEALVREVAEETGLVVEVGALLGEVRRPGATADVVYVIRDYEVRVLGGQARAGDDAADLHWVRLDDVPGYALVDGLLDTLTTWGVLNP